MVGAVEMLRPALSVCCLMQDAEGVKQEAVSLRGEGSDDKEWLVILWYQKTDQLQQHQQGVRPKYQLFGGRIFNP